jgi:hypothetical protein
MPDVTLDGRSQLLRRVLSTTGAAGLLAAGAIALAVPASASGSTIYVNPDGNNHDGCGTSLANQCATIQYGIGQAGVDDTVRVAAGTYNEALNIDKGITLQGAGTASIIDGSGLDPLTSGLVAVGTTDGNVKIDGFTVENAPPSSNGDPFAISLIDLNPADHITVSNNTILGNAGDPNPSTDPSIGIDSGDTQADTTIENNDISGVWQGVLMEGSVGAVDVHDNHLHNLLTWTDGETTYPAEGVYILSDKANSASNQNVVDNAFDTYGGIGIAFSAGYNLGGCTDPTCDGSASGAITGNTFDLLANPAEVAASAIRLRALNDGDTLKVSMGSNTGTVAADTKTIEETPNSGAITITPTGTPNAITPVPTPTLSVPVPTSVTVGAPAVTFDGTATNPVGGDPIAHARYDVTITGTSGITADQLQLQYNAGEGFQDVPLTGTASSDNSITGYFGPLSGFAFPAGTPLTTPFKLSVTDGDAPGGTLHTSISLDEVSSGTGNPVVNRLASTSSDTTIVATSSLTEEITPHPLTSADAPVVHVAVHTAGNSTGGTVTIHATSFDVTADVVDGAADVTLPKIIGGTHSLTASYSGTATTQASTDAFPISVDKAAVTLSSTISPTPTTTANTAKVTVTVGTAANTSGALVSIQATSFTVSAHVVNGKAVITLPKISSGNHPLTINYAGNASTLPASKTIVISVVKAASSMSFTTSPAVIKSTTTNATMTVTVSAGGASVNGGTVSLDGASHYGTATVSNGKAVIKLPRANKGAHSWKLTFSGTAAAAGSTKLITVTVH